MNYPIENTIKKEKNPPNHIWNSIHPFPVLHLYPPPDLLLFLRISHNPFRRRHHPRSRLRQWKNLGSISGKVQPCHSFIQEPTCKKNPGYGRIW